MVELRTRLDLLAEIKTLRGILLICAYCQKIRDDQNVWMALEAYLHAHADTRLSHGICPECLEEEMKKSNTSGVSPFASIRGGLTYSLLYLLGIPS